MADAAPRKIPTLSTQDLLKFLRQPKDGGWTELYVFGPDWRTSDHGTYDDVSNFFGSAADPMCIYRLVGNFPAEELSRLKSVQQFAYVGCQLDDTGVKHFQELKQLKKLNLWGNRIGLAGVKGISTTLQQLKKLSSLDLGDNNLGPAGIKVIATTLKKMTHLTSLHLRSNDLGPSGGKDIATALQNLKGLTSLDLGNNDLGPAGAENIATALQQLTDLKSLNLWNNDLGPTGAKVISPTLQQLKDLTSLNLGDNDIGFTGAKDIASVLQQMTKLTSLNLRGNDIDITGAKDITPALKKMTGLTSLDLGSNRIGPVGAKDIATALQQLTGLKSLNLWNNDIGPAGAKDIAFSLQLMTDLTSLNLGDNDIGSTGAKDIASALQQIAGLTSLNLRGNDIGLTGGKVIANSLKQMASLALLDLRGNGIDDASIRVLAEMKLLQKRLPHLQTIYLSDNDIHGVEKSLLETLDAERIFHAVLEGETLPHARVMLVGMGSVGKSWLLRKCFLAKSVSPKETRKETPDIDFFQAKDCQVSLGEYMDSRPSRMETTIWDFGGQAVKHGVHEGFFTDADQRTVFLLVVSARRAPDKGKGDNDETTGNRIVYWLKTLAHFVGPKSPVVIAITQCDDHNLPKDISSDWKQGKRPIDVPVKWNDENVMRLADTPPALLEEVFQVKVTKIVDGLSALDPKAIMNKANADEYEAAIHSLRSEVAQAIKTETVVMKAKVPAKYPKFAEEVTKFIETRTWSHLDEFREWCRKDEVGMPDEGDQDFLLPLLNAHGRLFRFGRPDNSELDEDKVPPGQRRRTRLVTEYRYDRQAVNLDNTVIHPEWMKRCVYQIVNQSEKQAWFRREKDIQPHIELATNTLKLSRQSEADDQLILEFLECTELCWEADDRLEYLFPRGLPSAEPRDWDRWHRWPCAPLEWDFLPEANFFRLMVALHKTKIGEEHCVVKLSGPSQHDQYQHGRNWIHIRDLDGGGSEAVVLAFPDDGRVELRFDPDHAGTPEGRNGLIQMVHYELRKIQGKPANQIPEDPMCWNGELLVDPDPAVELDHDVVARFYRLGMAYQELAPTSQGAVAKEVGCTTANVGKWEDKMHQFLRRKFPRCTVGTLTGNGMGKRGIKKDRLSEFGREAMKWSEFWFPDLLQHQKSR